MAGQGGAAYKRLRPGLRGKREKSSMSIWLAAVLATSVFVTSFVSGIFGMAGGMMLLWVLLLVMPAAGAIAVHGVIQLVSNGARAWFSRAYIAWPSLGLIVLGVLVAALALFLVRYEPDRVLIYFVVGAMPLLVWLPGRWLRLDASRPAQALLCGLVAGGLTLSVGLSGPTIDIFFIRTEMDRRTVIATKAAAQVVSHGAKVVFYAGAAFELGGGDWLAVALAAPIAILGTRAGNFVLTRMSDAGFRRWTRWIVTGIGLVYLVQGFLLVS